MKVTEVNQKDRQQIYEVGFYYGAAAITISKGYLTSAADVYRALSQTSEELAKFFLLGTMDGESFGKGVIRQHEKSTPGEFLKWIEAENKKVPIGLKENPYKIGNLRK